MLGLGTADVHQRDALVIVLEDLLVVGAAEGHALRAPLRHPDAVTEAASVEDEAVRESVDVAALLEANELAVGVEGALVRRRDPVRAEDVHVVQADRVAVRDPFGAAAANQVRGEQAALEAEVVTAGVLSDIARALVADDPRLHDTAGVRHLDELDTLRATHVEPARGEVRAELRRGELAVPFPARSAPAAVLREVIPRRGHAAQVRKRVREDV